MGARTIEAKNPHWKAKTSGMFRKKRATAAADLAAESRTESQAAFRPFYEPRPGVDGVWEIPLVLEAMQEVVETTVPVPLPYRKLNPDVLAYLEDAVDLLPKGEAARIVVYLPLEKIHPGLEAKVNKCLRIYSEARLAKLRREEKEAKSGVLTALLWGVVFMLACQIIRYFADFPNYPTVTSTISEGLLVLGWVALWDPFDAVLFDWRPSVKRRKRHERLAAFPIELRPLPATILNLIEAGRVL